MPGERTLTVGQLSSDTRATLFRQKDPMMEAQTFTQIRFEKPSERVARIVLARADDRRLAGADTIVSLGGQPSAPGWRIIFKGEAITIFAR